jgi:hypothetical protein
MALPLRTFVPRGLRGDGARMPTEKELPDSLKALSHRNAVTLSHHRFGSEVDELALALALAAAKGHVR